MSRESPRSSTALRACAWPMYKMPGVYDVTGFAREAPGPYTTLRACAWPTCHMYKM